MLFDHLMTIQYLMQPYKICVTYWCDNVFSLTVVSPEDCINMTLRVAIICYEFFVYQLIETFTIMVFGTFAHFKNNITVLLHV